MNFLAQKWRLPRRTFLKGAGVTLGLPFLEAMGEIVGGAAASASAAAPATVAKTLRAPVRMAALYFPNGVWKKDWFPKKDGRDYEVTPSLEPLQKHRERMIVFSGLNKHNSEGGDGHYAKTANFLTGLPVRKTTGKDLSVGGISIDQLCARDIGHHTPLPSLELGIDPVISGIDTNVGYTRLYGSYIAWQSPSVPVAREVDPKAAWQKLFGIIQARKDKAARTATPGDDERRALLDLVQDDAKSLRGKLGRDDQFKLDEYLDSVREVERRLAFFSKPEPGEWRPATQFDDHAMAAPAGIPGDHQEHVRLMMDLMVLAFWSDSTRISTFMFANDVSGKNFSRLIPGADGAHHEFSHHQNKAEKYGPYQKINRWHNEQYAYMLDRMAAIKEGEGTLLDNSMLLYGSSMSDGNGHEPNNLPILLAGGAGGTIKGGRHIANPGGTPLCNLYVSMLERMGTDVHSFGDSNGQIALG